MSRGQPLLLAGPTRFDRLSIGRARIGLVLAVLLIAIAALLPSAELLAVDPALGQAIVADMRGGAGYYAAAGAVQGPAGQAAIPLPALPLLHLWLPRIVLVAVAYALIGGVLYVWTARLRAAFVRPNAARVAVVLVALALLVWMLPRVTLLPQAWAALLIALSLGVRAPGRWLASVALGLCAAVVSEAAIPYLAVMALLAGLEGVRREALGWLVALILALAVLAAHLFAAGLRPGGLDPFADMLPFTAPIAVLALIGWAGWRDALGVRMAALGALYALLGAPLLVAPVLAGLVFLPDAARDLVRAALDKRRFTVTRSAR